MTRNDVKRVIGYVRVSTNGQGDSGAGLEAQRREIQRLARYRRWQVVEIAEEVASGKSLRKRPVLARALDDLKARKADALVVAKLDRVSRSVADFGRILETSRKYNWALVICDLDIDTSGPNGGLVANVLISVSQWEREMIGERTKKALAVKRSQGVKIGRRRIVAANVERHIRRMRSSGLSFERCADALNAKGLPAPVGGAWYWTTIRRVVNRGAAR